MSRDPKIWPGNVMILANFSGFFCCFLDKQDFYAKISKYDNRKSEF